MEFDKIERDTLLDFEISTNFPIISSMEQISTYFSDDVKGLYNFYNGFQKTVPNQFFDTTKKIKNLIKSVISIFISNNSLSGNYKYWPILDLFEDASSRLETIENYARWSRSNVAENVYSNSVEIKYVTRQNETLEDIEFRSLSLDPDNTWYQLALRNQLTEEQYTPAGGTPLKITFQRINPIFIESTVDIIDSSEKVFGKDIYYRIIYEDNDLKSLSYNDTLIQTCSILSQLSKGDNPEFRQAGLDKKRILGSNRNSILFPVIFRQLSQTFQSDDSFSGIQIQKINLEEDSIKIDINILSRTNEVQRQTIEI